GVAGQVEAQSGTVIFAPNLKWRQFHLGERVQQRCALPCTVVNDVRAATVGEWLYGAGRGCAELVALFIGTGIGGSAIAGGKLCIGSNNAAGEFGHIVLQMDGPLCTCGNRGCFEALAGGWAMARRLQERVVLDPAAGKQILQKVEGKVD